MGNVIQSLGFITKPNIKLQLTDLAVCVSDFIGLAFERGKAGDFGFATVR